MKCLVTGAAGFIGSTLCDYLLNKGLEVTGIDNFLDYYPRDMKEANISSAKKHPRFNFLEASLLDVDLPKVLDGVDFVFHQAAQAGVRASWGSSFKIYSDNNVLATQVLLEACKEKPVKKFVYASSSSIYGNSESPLMNEAALPRPVSPYGVSKLAAEHLCQLYWVNFKVPTVSLRYFTVYGPRQRPDMAFHRFFRWALKGEPLHVYGDGEQSRNFTHVNDIVEANWLAAEGGVPGEVLNIGGGARVTLRDVIALVEEITGGSVSAKHEASQKGDVRHTAADITKAKQQLGYDPKIGLEQGLRTEFEWIRKIYSFR